VKFVMMRRCCGGIVVASFGSTREAKTSGVFGAQEEMEILSLVIAVVKGVYEGRDVKSRVQYSGRIGKEA
jgi:hypothetical protein